MLNQLRSPVAWCYSISRQGWITLALYNPRSKMGELLFPIRWLDGERFVFFCCCSRAFHQHGSLTVACVKLESCENLFGRCFCLTFTTTTTTIISWIIQSPSEGSLIKLMTSSSSFSVHSANRILVHGFVISSSRSLRERKCPRRDTSKYRIELNPLITICVCACTSKTSDSW